MSAKKLGRVLLVAAALGAGAFSLRAQQPQGEDPVAEAARKARQQRKQNTVKPKKVLTEDDLGRNGNNPPPSQTAGGAATSGGAAEGGKTAQTDDAKKQGAEDPNGASAWKKKFAEQRAKIATAEKELDVLGREWEKNQTQYYSDPAKALMEQNSRKEINEHAQKIADKQKQIADLKQRLSDMEDELRKSGGNPGWARE